MQMVYKSTLIGEARLIHSILEANGIPNVIRNDVLQTLSGEVPFTSAWPEVWVLEEADADQARELIACGAPAANTPDWTCPSCGELIEGEFDACWKCGAFRDGAA